MFDAMAVLLALVSAFSYGASDFAAGVASRWYAPGPVSGIAQALGLITAVVALFLFPGHGPSGAALAWGAASGIGSAIGTLALYRGFAVARMTVVAALSAVLTAVIPALVGLVLGDHLTLTTALGIVVACPAIVLVSWQPEREEAAGRRPGVLLGMLAGAGFALLFIALDRAGTRSGAWPLVPGQIVSLVALAPTALRGARRAGAPTRRLVALVLGAGLLSGSANLLFLAATGRGQLAIVAVLTALYPAVTVVLARVCLGERWSRSQVVGLIVAVAAIVLVSAG
jgi:drug/metabolite transporter (DMT)-like permease